MIYTPPNLKTGLKSALSFDPATSDYVDVGQPILPTDGSSYSISVWANGQYIQNAYVIAQYIHDQANRTVPLLYYNDNWVYFDGQTEINNIKPQTSGVWEHFVVVNDGSGNVIVYNNSVNLLEVSGVPNVLNTNTTIGGYGGTWGGFNGLISNVRIYNRTLTAGEIKLLSIGMPISTVGLVGYWPMTYGSGTTAYDRSGNGNHGTLNGSPTWTTDTPW